jgi:3-isopropylmalate/(R)-2-methylmalate dehydratase small subunit
MSDDARIHHVAGRGVPVRGNDIDTDRIIPARYLREITFETLGPHAFEDERRQLNGKHPFDDARFTGASILVVNRNFGSGSSREHAPQALKRRGIGAIVGESFAEIFFGNCTTIGVPCLTLPAAQIESLQSLIEEAPETQVAIDVASGAITAGQATYRAELPASVRQAFVSGGWDALSSLLESGDAISAVYERLPYIRSWPAR